MTGGSLGDVGLDSHRNRSDLHLTTNPGIRGPPAPPLISRSVNIPNSDRGGSMMKLVDLPADDVDKY